MNATMNTKLTTAQEIFIESLTRYPDQSFAYENKTMKALVKKGIIEKCGSKITPSGIRFWTYQIK